ncbi:MAG: hypothetical protein LLG04_02960 [Parachlamydia sp.]|nr:hypothetical protein [Parachlamydia sp.]
MSATTSIKLNVSDHLVRQTYYLEKAFGDTRTYIIASPKAEGAISAVPLSEKRITVLSPKEVLIHLDRLSPQEKASGHIDFWYCKEPLVEKKAARPLPKGFPNDWNGTPVGLDPRYGFVTFKV